MADEAVIRVVVQDGGGSGGSGTGGGASAGGGGSAGSGGFGGLGGGGSGGGSSAAGTNAMMAKLAKASQNYITQMMSQAVAPPAQPPPATAPMMAKLTKASQNYMTSMMGQAASTFNAQHVPPPVNPMMAKLGQASQTYMTSMMATAASTYAQQNPAPKPSMFAGALKLADKFRGTLGGLLGPGVGAGIDAASLFMGAAGAASPLVLVGVAAAAAAVGLKAFDKVISPLIDRFAPYSAAITGAESQAELRRELNDMRRAGDAGPRFADYINARSQMSETWEDIKTALVESLAPAVTSILEILNGVILPLLKVGLAPLEALFEIVGIITQGLVGILRFLRIIADKDDVTNVYDFNPLRDILQPSGGGI